ncbi:MAG: hypothetical protein IIA60_09430 [Candidatus Marinimicrobia bacterium]|nr:hypothetical protein [Candidatus Neomarinimicrobiota bacterium]
MMAALKKIVIPYPGITSQLYGWKSSEFMVTSADGATRPMFLPLFSNESANAKQHRDWMIVPNTSET